MEIDLSKQTIELRNNLKQNQLTMEKSKDNERYYCDDYRSVILPPKKQDDDIIVCEQYTALQLIEINKENAIKKGEIIYIDVDEDADEDTSISNNIQNVIEDTTTTSTSTTESNNNVYNDSDTLEKISIAPLVSEIEKKDTQDDTDIENNDSPEVKNIRNSNSNSNHVINNTIITNITTQAQHSNNDTNIQSILLCPLTSKLLNVPVVASDGFTYEKDAIEKYIKDNTNLLSNECISPITGMIMPHLHLSSNLILKDIISAYIQG